MNVKKYLPLLQKQTLVDTAVEACIIEKNGLFFVDHVFKEYFFNKFFMEAYADIKFSDSTDAIDEYDKYCQDGTLDTIIKEANKEYWYLHKLVENTAYEQVKQMNSINGIIARFMDTKNIQELAEAFKNVNPELAQTIANIQA